MAIIARCILANAAQEQAHVFRAAMMHRNGFPGPETCRSSPGDTDHNPAVIQDTFRQDAENSAAGRLQTDRLVLRTGGRRIRHRAFPAAQGRALGPSRPFGLRSLTQDAGKNYPTLISSNPFKSADCRIEQYQTNHQFQESLTTRALPNRSTSA